MSIALRLWYYMLISITFFYLKTMNATSTHKSVLASRLVEAEECYSLTVHRILTHVTITLIANLALTMNVNGRMMAAIQTTLTRNMMIHLVQWSNVTM